MLYRFTEKESEVLLGLALHNVVQCATEYECQGMSARDELLIATRIVAELHEPTPSMRAALAPGVERTANHLGIDMVEAAAREGIDVEKELGSIDPRANRPRCIHGRLFSEPCIDCCPSQLPMADGRPTRIMPFEVSAEESAALDDALAQRREELGLE